MTEHDMRPTTPYPLGASERGGRRLAGRYRLGARIGRGGMADVYRATDERLARDVAVKIFRTREDSAQQAIRWRSEVRTLATLQHPGLVTIYDAADTTDTTDTAVDNPLDSDGEPFLVMELIDGPSLADRLADGPLAPARAAELGGRIAAALAYVHQHGIVHRDVKPANILLAPPVAGASATWSVKLTDFGIARLLDDTRLTTTGMTIGTANYLSPEQATGARVGPASDIYSLGLVLLECVTGTIAFPGHGIPAAAARLHRRPEMPASLGPSWTRLLAAMTAPDPHERPNAETVSSTLAAFGSSDIPTIDLKAAAATVPLSAQPTAALPTALPTSGEAKPRIPWRRRVVWLSALIAAAAVAAIIVPLAVTQTSGSSPAASHTTRAATAPPTSSPATPRPSTTPAASPTPAVSPTLATTAPTATPVAAQPPRTAGQALSRLRAAIANDVANGNLDVGAANDLDNRIADITRTLNQGTGAAARHALQDAGHKLADLTKHLADLTKNGQLTTAGYQALRGPLAALEHFLPVQH